MIAFVVWVMGIFLEGSTPGCVSTAAFPDVCISGGNPVPHNLTEEYIPVIGTDGAIELNWTF